MLLEVLVLYSIASIVIIIGLLLNGFIIIANLFWWMKSQTHQTINVIITGMGLVRILLLGLYANTISFSVFNFSVYDAETYLDNLSTLITCMIFCNLWWSSVLCVFYCVKITNYSNRLFLRLKMHISKMVPWLLLISFLISFLSSLPCKWFCFSIYVNGTKEGNGTKEAYVVNMFIIAFAGSIIPFMICCVAIYLIILSVLRHTKNMSSRDSSFKDTQRDIHLSVIWNMVSFLLFYALYVVVYIAFSLTVSFGMVTFRLICFICICCYPSIHSIFLIVNNKELKNSFWVVVSCTWIQNVKQQNT